jgi:hypothetical protein
MKWTKRPPVVEAEILFSEVVTLLHQAKERDLADRCCALYKELRNKVVNRGRPGCAPQRLRAGA